MVNILNLEIFLIEQRQRLDINTGEGQRAIIIPLAIHEGTTLKSSSTRIHLPEWAQCVRTLSFSTGWPWYRG